MSPLAANAVRLRLHALAAVSDEHPSAPLLPKLACSKKALEVEAAV
jgi:hypothetical protein